MNQHRQYEMHMLKNANKQYSSKTNTPCCHASRLLAAGANRRLFKISLVIEIVIFRFVFVISQCSMNQ